jgi:hypothetical protein
MKKLSFEELKKLHGKSIDLITPIEEQTEPEKGIITINGVRVFNCYSNEVYCNNTFAVIHFYNKTGETVANLDVFNVDNECLVIEECDRIYSETSLRVLNNNY